MDLPDEVSELFAKAKLARERMSMEIEADELMLQRFIDSQDEEGLRCVRMLMTLCLTSKEQGMFQLGVISEKMNAKFNVCLHCGKKDHATYRHDSDSLLSQEERLEND